jgi:hypothetical protein
MQHIADQHLEQALDEILSLEMTIQNVSAIELKDCAIPFDWKEVGGVRIGLDAGGTAVRVELSDHPGWVAE